MDQLKKINDDLYQAAILLDSIPSKIKSDPSLENRENILLIGKALSHIFELQNNIYKIRPDLKINYQQ